MRETSVVGKPDVERARDLLTDGCVEHALFELERCLEQGVAPVSARFFYGLCRFRLEDFDAAASDFEEVLRQRPGDHIAHFYAGLCYERLGRVTEARTARRIAFELIPAGDGTIDHRPVMPNRPGV